MNTIGRLFAVLFCLVAVCVATAADRTLPPLPVAVTAAALNPQTGDVAIAGAASGQVWLLPGAWLDDPSSPLIGPLVETSNPTSVLFKQFGQRSYLVVGCFDGQGIVVLDAATKKILSDASVTTTSPTIFVSASDNDQDPWVYTSGLHGSQIRLNAFRIDTVPPQFRWVNVPGPSGSPFRLSQGHYVVSSNGHFLYAASQKTQRQIVRWRLGQPATTQGAPVAEFLTAVSTANWQHPLIRLPMEQGLAQGSSLWRPDLSPLPQALPFRAACATSDAPLIIGLANRDLRITSLLTGKLVARKHLPRGLIAPSEQAFTVHAGLVSHRQVLPPIVLADRARDRIVVLVDRQAYTIPMASLKLPDEPLLAAAVDGPSRVVAESQVAFEVKPGDPRIEVELAHGPAGMRLENGQMTWTPTLEQLGEAPFSLRLGFQAASVNQEHQLTVVGPSIPCPFPATQAVRSASGRQLVVWQSSPSRIALIDIATHEVIATRDLPCPIVSAALEGETLCVLTVKKQEGTLLRLDSKTLATEVERPIPVQSTVRYLEGAAVSLHQLTVTIETKSGNRLHYSLPDLTDNAAPGVSGDGGNGLLVDLPGFVGPAAHPQNRPANQPPPPRSVQTVFRTHELQASSAVNVQHGTILSEAFPVRLGLQLDHQSVPGFTRLDLVARPLQDGQVVQRWVVDAWETAQLKRDLPVFWTVDGSTGVILSGGKAYLKDLHALAESGIPQPFRITPAPFSPLADLEHPTRVGYVASGGKAPYALDVVMPTGGATQSFTLATAIPGQPGQYYLNLMGYVNDQLAVIAESLTAWSPETASPETIMTEYAASVAARFGDIVGKQPHGVPVAVPIVVTARDASGQTHTVSHYLLADLPRELLTLSLNVAVRKRWPGTVIASEAEANINALQGPQRSPELLRILQGISRRPHTRHPPDELAAAAEDALAKCRQRWQQTLDRLRQDSLRQPLRRWVDVEGNATVARFEQYFAGQVIVKLEGGSAVAFAIQDLSEADQVFVRTLVAALTTDDPQPLDATLVRRTQLQQIATAALNFHGAYRILPPTSFVGPDGHGTLSWRVMLLPYLGGKELYELFHLDEPWDSPHNKRLASYMPPVYQVAGVAAESPETPIVRLQGPQTVSPLERRIRLADIVDGTSNTLFAVIADARHAVVWTEPQDLKLDGTGVWREALWWHDKQATVVMCDAKSKLVGESTSDQVWQAAASRGEGSPLRFDE